ncbi:MAG: CBS domain-containing protein [Candidatus Aquicultor sp.]|nr:CBS domain-containing protein [Candidatus Aquicultor sp.]
MDMLVIRKTKNLMVDVDKYPHIPSDISLKQAIEIVKDSMLEGQFCFQPMIALVMDNNRLVGTLRLRDILQGLEPNFMKTATSAQGFSGDTLELAAIWDTLFDTESKELVEKPVREVMRPVKVYVEPEDPIVKAAYLMIHNDLMILPVIENKKKLVGLVRMVEVFSELSDSILKKEDFMENILEFRRLV